VLAWRSEPDTIASRSAGHVPVQSPRHRGDDSEAERLPAGAGRHDPGSGHGDDEVVRHAHCADHADAAGQRTVILPAGAIPGDPVPVMAGEQRGDPQVIAQMVPALGERRVARTVVIVGRDSSPLSLAILFLYSRSSKLSVPFVQTP